MEWHSISINLHIEAEESLRKLILTLLVENNNRLFLNPWKWRIACHCVPFEFELSDIYVTAVNDEYKITQSNTFFIILMKEKNEFKIIMKPFFFLNSFKFPYFCCCSNSIWMPYNRPFATMGHVTYPSLHLILGTLWILEMERAGKNVEQPSLRSVALKCKIWRQFKSRKY